MGGVCFFLCVILGLCGLFIAIPVSPSLSLRSARLGVGERQTDKELANQAPAGPRCEVTV